MSSTKRGRERNRQDNYPTEQWPTKRIIEALPLLPNGIWLEPAAGKGDIISAVEFLRPGINWVAVEIRRSAIEQMKKLMIDRIAIYHQDFFKMTWGQGKFAVGITNPPFSLAQEFLIRMREICDHVLLLLRLNYYSGARADFLRLHNPDIYVLPNRPSFMKKRFVSRITGRVSFRKVTDSIEYAWFHWGPGTTGQHYMLPDTPLEERRQG